MGYLKYKRHTVKMISVLADYPSPVVIPAKAGIQQKAGFSDTESVLEALPKNWFTEIGSLLTVNG
jgi:hypothetical protein